MSSDFRGEEVKTESSWAGPARILFITLILAGGFVYYYFGPSVEDIQGNSPKASTSREPVIVSVAGEQFTIPQNYTQFMKTRRGGVQDKVDLYAILPDFEGFTIAHEDEFEGNSSNSPIVHIELGDLAVESKEVPNHQLTQRMTEREKFERIYLPLVVDPKGEPARYGFTRYRLTDKWAQKDEDLFVHEASDGGVVLYRCLQPVATMPSPWCRRDVMLTDRLGLGYRFKRERLSDWRDIDRGVTRLVETFRHGSATTAPGPGLTDTAPATSQLDDAPATSPAPPTSQIAAPEQNIAAPQAPAAPASDEFKLVPQGAPVDSAAPATAAQPAAPKVHKIDPNADPDTDEVTAPDAVGDTPSKPLPPIPPPAEGGH